MSPGRRPALLAAASVCVAAGMAACRSVPGPGSLLDVPFVAQGEGECGPAALDMALAYHGHRIGLSNLVAATYLPALRGTIPELLVLEAQRHGVNAEVKRGQPADLARWLAQGTPPILYLKPKGDAARGHFAVLTGITPGGWWLRLHTGTRANRWRTAGAVLAEWEDGRGTAVVLSPDQTAPCASNPAEETRKK